MRIAFSTTVLARGIAHSGIDGIGSYALELGRILASHPGISLVPVGFDTAVSEKDITGAERNEVLGRYDIKALSAALTGIPFSAQPLIKRQVDIFHATDHLIPNFSNVPVVATLFDAIPLSHPEWVRTRFSQLKSWLWKRTALWADHILTISNHSKSEIIKHFGIPAEKISVTPLGVDARFFEVIEHQIKLDVMRRLQIPGAFFLFVGTLQPRKNIDRVLAAHAALPKRLQEEIPLIIVGRAGWRCDALVRRLVDSDKSACVRWLQYLPDMEVRVLMQSAKALIFPSLCEGFGLPVLEAFASELPVITSNTTSLPEVAGDAALMVDPMNVAQIAEAMYQIIFSPGLAQHLIEKGKIRAREFSWDACSNATLAVYRQVAGCS